MKRILLIVSLLALAVTATSCASEQNSNSVPEDDSSSAVATEIPTEKTTEKATEQSTQKATEKAAKKSTEKKKSSSSSSSKSDKHNSSSKNSSSKNNSSSNNSSNNINTGNNGGTVTYYTTTTTGGSSTGNGNNNSSAGNNTANSNNNSVGNNNTTSNNNNTNTNNNTSSKIWHEAEYKYVNHPARTEKVWVVDKAAYTYEEPVYETQSAYICNDCGMDITNIMKEHGIYEIRNGGTGSYHVGYIDVQVDTKTITVPEQGHYETQVVKEAWTEKVLVREAGYY